MDKQLMEKMNGMLESLSGTQDQKNAVASTRATWMGALP